MRLASDMFRVRRGASRERLSVFGFGFSQEALPVARTSVRIFIPMAHRCALTCALRTAPLRPSVELLRREGQPACHD